LSLRPDPTARVYDGPSDLLVDWGYTVPLPLEAFGILVMGGVKT